jgi:GNAT superfamily N-acetyltransferase
VLTVGELDLTNEGELRDAYAVLTEANEQDTPDEPWDDFATFAAQLPADWEGQRRARFLARVDGEPAGFAALALYTGDNHMLADIVVLVARPALRRRGVGRALFTALRDRAAGDGRTALLGGTEVAIPGGTPRPVGGDRFALAMGGVEATRFTTSRLHLADEDLPARLENAINTARVRAAGYSVVGWRDHAPEEYVADLAALYSRTITDQPMGTLGIVAEHYDAERFRAAEQSVVDHGCRSYCVAARHEATGRVVGYTEIAVRGGRGWQGTTIVEPEHRGHRLGLLIKAVNALETRRAEPEVRFVSTQNNDENSYMLDINRTIGFRPHCARIDYRIELA